ncbi:MAG: YbhN family protein, partial [Acidobacteriota bacterium]
WVLRPLCRVKRLAAFKALMISVLVNTLLPAARPLGGLIRARALTSSSGREPGPIYGGTLLDQMGYSVVSAIAGAFCIPWSLLPAAGRTRALPWSGWALLAALVSFLIWGLSEPARRHRLREWVRRRLPRTAETVAGAMEASRTLARRTGTYVLMVVGGSLVWFASAVVLMITARAVGAPIALHTAAAAWAVGSLAGAVSGTPGGMGATESAALLPLMGAGMTLPAALAAILLARGLHYVSALLIGSVCWIASGSMARRAGGGDGPGAMELTAPETALPASSAAPGGLPPQDRLSQ